MLFPCRCCCFCAESPALLACSCLTIGYCCTVRAEQKLASETELNTLTTGKAARLSRKREFCKQSDYSRLAHAIRCTATVTHTGGLRVFISPFLKGTRLSWWCAAVHAVLSARLQFIFSRISRTLAITACCPLQLCQCTLRLSLQRKYLKLLVTNLVVVVARNVC